VLLHLLLEILLQFAVKSAVH